MTITTQELKNKNFYKQQFEEQKKVLFDKINFEISPEDWTQLELIIKQQTTRIRKATSYVHNKKFMKLGIKKIDIDSKFVNKRRNNIEKSESFNESKVSTIYLVEN
jgi:gamma-glutamyltranspeptidase